MSEGGFGLIRTQAYIFDEIDNSISDNSSDDEMNSIDLRKYNYYMQTKKQDDHNKIEGKDRTESSKDMKDSSNGIVDLKEVELEDIEIKESGKKQGSKSVLV